MMGEQFPVFGSLKMNGLRFRIFINPADYILGERKACVTEHSVVRDGKFQK
jgi:hypothetical protein